MTLSDGIALTALLFSLFTYFTLQRRLGRIEKDRRMEEVEARKRAEIRPEIVRGVNSKGRSTANFVLTNSGQSQARRISFEISPLGDGSPPPVMTQGHEIPIPRLDPGQRYSFVAALMHGMAPACEILLKWEDGSGIREEIKTISVY